MSLYSHRLPGEHAAAKHTKAINNGTQMAVNRCCMVVQLYYATICLFLQGETMLNDRLMNLLQQQTPAGLGCGLMVALPLQKHA